MASFQCGSNVESRRSNKMDALYNHYINGTSGQVYLPGEGLRGQPIELVEWTEWYCVFIQLNVNYKRVCRNL